MNLPWKAKRSRIGSDLWHVTSPDCWVTISVPEEEARLIAAAPEMLAALKRTILHVEDDLADDYGFLSQKDEAYVSKLRAIIAKAEGTND